MTDASHVCFQILAAAELLTDTSLDANQTSFLQTVQVKTRLTSLLFLLTIG